MQRAGQIWSDYVLSWRPSPAKMISRAIVVDEAYDRFVAMITERAKAVVSAESVIPAMKKPGGGSIINIASINGFQPARSGLGCAMGPDAIQDGGVANTERGKRCSATAWGPTARSRSHRTVRSSRSRTRSPTALTSSPSTRSEERSPLFRTGFRAGGVVPVLLVAPQA